MREYFALVRACREQFTADCGRMMDESRPGMASLVEAMTFFTVFDSPEKDAAITGLNDVNIHVRMTEASIKFHHDLTIFDRDLLQRYRSLTSVCPYSKADFIPLDLDITLPRYWQLSPQGYAEVKSQMQYDTDLLAQQIQEWPRSRCVETRNFGAMLLHSLELRLQPFAQHDWERHLPRKRFDDAIGHAFVLAVEFEELRNPDVMNRIEARMLEFEAKNKTRPVAP